MSVPAYPAYKDSGVEWLGEVPAHWALRRLGAYFVERREKVSDVDFPALSVTKTGIVPQLETAAKTDDGDNRKGVRAGDFVINSRSDRKGSSGLAPIDGSVSLINTVLLPGPDAHGPFVHHLLRSVAFQEEFYRYGKGIVADLWSTNYSEMRNILLAMPPLEEQAAVAAFLDRETGKIDALVEEQRRLIALLKEKRQAVISHAVTKGLNPQAPLKPSGIEWLGDIPAHWEVVSIRRFARSVQTGNTPVTEPASAEADGGIPWFTPGDIGRSLELSSAAKKISEICAASGEARIFSAGSVLVVGIGATLGRVGFVTDRCSGNQQINAIMPDNSVDHRFLALSLVAQTDVMKLLSNASTIGIMNQERTKEITILRPPMLEQREIVERVLGALGTLDLLSEEAEAAVVLLQERRAALISAAVTGKIDVRGLVATPGALEAA